MNSNSSIRLTLFLLAFSIWATVSQSVLRQTTLLTSARLSLGFLLSLLSALALLATCRSSQTVLHSRQRSKSQTKQLYLERNQALDKINLCLISNQPVSFGVFSRTSVSFARWNVWVAHKKSSLKEYCYFLVLSEMRFLPDRSTIEVFFRTLDNKELDARETFRTVSCVFSYTETCNLLLIKVGIKYSDTDKTKYGS